jgi:hypothetical protein
MKKKFLFTTDSNISNFCLFFTVLFFINCSNQKKSTSDYNSSNADVTVKKKDCSNEFESKQDKNKFEKIEKLNKPDLTTKKNDFPDEFESKQDKNKSEKIEKLNKPDLTTKKNKKNDELGSEEWAEKERRKIEEDHENNIKKIKEEFKIKRENEEKRSALVLDELEKKYQVEKSEIELAIKKSENDYNFRTKKMNEMNEQALKKLKEKNEEDLNLDLDLENIDTNISFRNPQSDKKKISVNNDLLKKEDKISLQEKIENLFNLLPFKDEKSIDLKSAIESLKKENSQKRINISIFWDKIKELEKDWSYDLMSLSKIMDIFCFSMDQIYGNFGKSEFLKILKKGIDEMVIELDDALFQIVKFVSLKENEKSEINQIYFEKIKSTILKDKKASLVKILKDKYPNLNFEEFIEFIKNKDENFKNKAGHGIEELSKAKSMLLASMCLEIFFKRSGIKPEEMLDF